MRSLAYAFFGGRVRAGGKRCQRGRNPLRFAQNARPRPGILCVYGKRRSRIIVLAIFKTMEPFSLIFPENWDDDNVVRLITLVINRRICLRNLSSAEDDKRGFYGFSPSRLNAIR